MSADDRPPRAWLGFWLSLLCLVHCLGMALLVPLLPALALVAENEALEWALLALSATLAGRSCWRRGGARLYLWAAATGLGLAGLIFDGERLLQIAFALLAAVQLGQVVRRACRCQAPGCPTCGGGPNLTRLRRRAPPRQA
jgi:hypothetical protein